MAAPITCAGRGSRSCRSLAAGAAATGSVPITLVAGCEYLITTGTSCARETNPQNNYRQIRFIVA